MSTPYQKYKQYFRSYHRNYWRTHKEYHNRQKQLKKNRYPANSEKERLRAKKYITRLYSSWFEGEPKPTINHEKNFAAKRVALEKILPNEGFRKILWPEGLRSGEQSDAGKLLGV